MTFLAKEYEESRLSVRFARPTRQPTTGLADR